MVRYVDAGDRRHPHFAIVSHGRDHLIPVGAVVFDNVNEAQQAEDAAAAEVSARVFRLEAYRLPRVIDHLESYKVLVGRHLGDSESLKVEALECYLVLLIPLIVRHDHELYELIVEAQLTPVDILVAHRAAAHELVEALGLLMRKGLVFCWQGFRLRQRGDSPAVQPRLEVPLRHLAQQSLGLFFIDVVQLGPLEDRLHLELHEGQVFLLQ